LRFIQNCPELHRQKPKAGAAFRFWESWVVRQLCGLAAFALDDLRERRFGGFLPICQLTYRQQSRALPLDDGVESDAENCQRDKASEFVQTKLVRGGGPG